MRQRQEYDTHRPDPPPSHDAVELHGDYAVRNGNDVRIGCIRRIVLDGQYGPKDYRLQVPYSPDKRTKLEVTLSLYEQAYDDDTNVYFKPSGQSLSVRFTNIFCHVNMEFTDGVYRMTKSEYAIIFKSTEKGTVNSTRKSVKRSRTERQSQDLDGLVTEIILPSSSTDGSRKSQRKRKVKTSLTSFM